MVVIYKFHASNTTDYMNEVFSHVESNRVLTRCSYQELKLPPRKTNQSLRALSYIGQSLWNKLLDVLENICFFKCF